VGENFGEQNGNKSPPLSRSVLSLACRGDDAMPTHLCLDCPDHPSCLHDELHKESRVLCRQFLAQSRLERDAVAVANEDPLHALVRRDALDCVLHLGSGLREQVIGRGVGGARGCEGGRG
jgi:hypothetical protein